MANDIAFNFRKLTIRKMSRSLDNTRAIDSDEGFVYARYVDEHYVFPPYDENLGAWRVGRDVNYPAYANDNWARTNSYDWRRQQLTGIPGGGPHRSEIYAPLNENAEKSLEYRKYIPDESGKPTYWYRHTTEPSYVWMFEQSAKSEFANPDYGTELLP
jgi:hypothetical protein